MSDTLDPVAHGPDVCILRERDLRPALKQRSGSATEQADPRTLREAMAQLAARSLTAALDPACPHDAELLSAIERWRYGDHA